MNPPEVQAADDHPGFVVWFQIQFCHPSITLDEERFFFNFVFFKKLITNLGRRAGMERQRQGRGKLEQL